MVNLSKDNKNKRVHIENFDGNMLTDDPGLERTLIDSPPCSFFNFFRENNNFAYVGGDIAYSGDCNNNIVISEYPSNRLSNVRNGAIILGGGSCRVYPIKNLERAIKEGGTLLGKRRIIYHIPASISERENLIEKDTEEIRKEIKTLGISTGSQCDLFDSQ